MPWSILSRPRARKEPESKATDAAPATVQVQTLTPSTRKQVVFGLLVVAALVLVLFLVRDVMGPFVLGGLLAFMIEPLVSRLTRSGLPRAVAILITLLAILLGLSGLFALLVPLFTDEIPLLQAQATGLAVSAQGQLSQLEGAPPIVFGYRIDLSGTARLLAARGEEFLLGQFGNALSFAITALGTFFQIGLMLLIAFLVSLDARRIGRFLRSLSPTAYRWDLEAVLAEVEQMLYGYVKGQLVVALLIGLLSGLAVWLIGLKYALALGLLAGVTALVPYLGPFLGVVPAVVVALSTGWQQAVAVVITYVLIGTLLLNVVYPKIVGGAVRLPPLVVIVALVAGFSLAGVLGMFVAVPIAATARIAYDHFQLRLFGPPGPGPQP
ncbi:MAG: AI-2E family transporter [Candidatus Dormibacteraeota bacterium]|nr:AI-2E family transporter [Candidatus Dormibacteraeota bacterium]